jgi:branched-chain amino acid transport system substrate-binding protein
LAYNGKVFGCSTYATDNMVKLGGKELLEGMYLEGVTFEINREKPEVKEWRKRYLQRYNREATGFSLVSYQSIQLLADAIARANSTTEKEKIREAASKTDLRKTLLGYYGKPNFDEKGQVHPYLGALQYRDGKRVVVYVSTKAN